jgi:DNA-binding XRE family transcriptional regulator
LTKGLKQKELAELLGVDETTIVNWEKDRTEPMAKNEAQLTKFFGVKEIQRSGDVCRVIDPDDSH